MASASVPLRPIHDLAPPPAHPADSPRFRRRHDRTPPSLAMSLPSQPGPSSYHPAPQSAGPKRPLSPGSLRDVDLSGATRARDYPPPPTGHDLMALFPASAPTHFAELRPTSGYFHQQERAFFAQAGKEIIRTWDAKQRDPAFLARAAAAADQAHNAYPHRAHDPMDIDTAPAAPASGPARGESTKGKQRHSPLHMPPTRAWPAPSGPGSAAPTPAAHHQALGHGPPPHAHHAASAPPAGAPPAGYSPYPPSAPPLAPSASSASAASRGPHSPVGAPQYGGPGQSGGGPSPQTTKFGLRTPPEHHEHARGMAPPPPLAHAHSHAHAPPPQQIAHQHSRQHSAHQQQHSPPHAHAHPHQQQAHPHAHAHGHPHAHSLPPPGARHPDDEYDGPSAEEEAWRRAAAAQQQPPPQAERRRAGKHTKRVIVK